MYIFFIFIKIPFQFVDLPLLKKFLRSIWPTAETISLICILNDLAMSRWRIGCAGRYLDRYLTVSSAMTLGVMSKTGASLGCRTQSNCSSKSYVLWWLKLSGASATKKITWDFIWCIQRAFATTVFLLTFTPVQQSKAWCHLWVSTLNSITVQV